jgi:hypothetical protein
METEIKPNLAIRKVNLKNWKKFSDKCRDEAYKIRRKTVLRDVIGASAVAEYFLRKNASESTETIITEYFNNLK